VQDLPLIFSSNMKTAAFWKWSLGLLVAALPLAGGCDQESANSSPASLLTTNPSAGNAVSTITNSVSPEAAQKELETAPGKIVSTPAPPPQSVQLSAPAEELVKLAQAGVDESVMLSFVSNSSHTFNLSSDGIIYLNDLGVPGTVVTAMIQHDQDMKETSLAAASPPPAPPVETPSAEAPPETTQSDSQPQDVTDSGQQAPPQSNVSYSYFYDSLSPYGNWINVEGYGLCWQPTVVVVNSGWRPYCDGGHWAYTDCGWYWVSDYSWGWAPFHYGRWFWHTGWGWCWAPDTVWGPAWVSWRYGDSYCGWAPLPPTACYTPGIGFTYFGQRVGFTFGFGLSPWSFTFVGFNHFTDRHWHQYRLASSETDRYFGHSRIANRIFDRRGTRVNEGVPISRITAATHRQIPRMQLRDAPDPASARAWRIGDNRTLPAYRLRAPLPTHETALVGQSVRANPEMRRSPALRSGTARVFGNPERGPGTSATQEQRIGPASTARNRTLAPARTPQRSASGRTSDAAPGTARTTAPLIFRGWQRSPAPNAQQHAAPAMPAVLPNHNQVERTQPASRQPIAPTQRNSQATFENRPQSTIRAESPARRPVQTRIQSPPIFRQEAPKYLNQDQRTFTSPAIPAPQAQPTIRTRSWAPAAEPREQQQWISPSPRSSQPSGFSLPATRANPQISVRQSPPPQVAPESQRSSGTFGVSRGAEQGNNGNRRR
jgi:Family of unknown function (DUF6600)